MVGQRDRLRFSRNRSSRRSRAHESAQCARIARSADLRAIGGTGRRKTTAAIAPGIKITVSRREKMGRNRDRTPKLRDRETVDDFVDVNTRRSHASPNAITARPARGAMFSARRRAALSWNRGVPPLVGWVGMGILTVVLIVGFAAAKKEPKDDEQGAHQLKRLAVGMLEPATHRVSC